MKSHEAKQFSALQRTLAAAVRGKDTFDDQTPAPLFI
jgi:hypothetical protein